MNGESDETVYLHNFNTDNKVIKEQPEGQVLV